MQAITYLGDSIFFHSLDVSDEQAVDNYHQGARQCNCDNAQKHNLFFTQIPKPEKNFQHIKPNTAIDVSFRKHFLEMAGLSMGVAALSFGIGILVREILGVEI